MANVVKFVQIVPEIKTDKNHNNALYTVYPNMHIANLKFLYICADICGVSIYSADPAAEGCPHPNDHKKHICRIEGEEADVNAWIANNSDKVTELTTQQADTLGKVLAPEHEETDMDGNTVTVAAFDINNYL